MNHTDEIYFAGGCLWGVQEFFRHVPGVLETEAGRINGTSQTLSNEYDGYAEGVRVCFDAKVTNLYALFLDFFEIINPYSLNQQGEDIGEKYRTGIYSQNINHRRKATQFIKSRDDSERIMVEIKTLKNFVRSADEHQNRLARFPLDYCHIPKNLMDKYKSSDH
ncbi:MAG: peptide-methionine (S)-S-oxide reductase [Spirochaetales bacterium]|nr:peptide-methionine (S)-S-oxide reductase [Spirochaetales bacterium]